MQHKKPIIQTLLFLVFTLSLVACGDNHSHHKKMTKAEFAKAFKQHGDSVLGKIIKRYKRNAITKTGKKIKRPMIEYSFSVKSKKYKGKAQLSEDVWKVVAVGESVQIDYLTNQPKESRLTEGQF